MLRGLEYLHSQEQPVIHRDIKGANVGTLLTNVAGLNHSREYQHAMHRSVDMLVCRICYAQGVAIPTPHITSVGCVYLCSYRQEVVCSQKHRIIFVYGQIGMLAWAIKSDFQRNLRLG